MSMSESRCRNCRQPVSRLSSSLECSVCERLTAAVRIRDDQQAAQLLVARKAAGVYRRPQDHDDEEDYLASMTVVFDALCRVLGLPEPAIHNVWRAAS